MTSAATWPTIYRRRIALAVEAANAAAAAGDTANQKRQRLEALRAAAQLVKIKGSK